MDAFIFQLLSATKSDSSSTITTVFIIIVVIIFISIIAYLIELNKCPKCKKREALELINRELIGTRNTTKTEKRDVKNKKGEVIGQTEVEVPYTIETYKVTLKCKYCGHVVTRENEKRFKS